MEFLLFFVRFHKKKTHFFGGGFKGLKFGNFKETIPFTPPKNKRLEPEHIYPLEKGLKHRPKIPALFVWVQKPFVFGVFVAEFHLMHNKEFTKCWVFRLGLEPLRRRCCVIFHVFGKMSIPEMTIDGAYIMQKMLRGK